MNFMVAVMVILIMVALSHVNSFLSKTSSRVGISFLSMGKKGAKKISFSKSQKESSSIFLELDQSFVWNSMGMITAIRQTYEMKFLQLLFSANMEQQKLIRCSEISLQNDIILWMRKMNLINLEGFKLCLCCRKCPNLGKLKAKSELYYI